MTDNTLSYASPTVRSPGRFGRFLLRPIGWPLHAMTAGAALIWVVGGIPPHGHFGHMILGFYAWTAVGLLWFARLVARGGAARYYAVKLPARDYRRWLVAPIVLGVTVGLLWLDVPFRVGYRLSRGAMDRYAATEVARVPNAAGKLDDPPRRIGLYRVSRVERFDGGLRFVVDGAGFLDEVGFAYSPAGPPPKIGSDAYEPIGDGWYKWREGWF